MTRNFTIYQNNFLSVVYLSTRIYVFTFQTGVREVFNCYRCRSEYLHKEQGNLSDLQEKMHEADGAKDGEMHAISCECKVRAD